MLIPRQLWERHSSGPEAMLFFCIMIAWVAIPIAAIILSMYGLSRGSGNPQPNPHLDEARRTEQPL